MKKGKKILYYGLICFFALVFLISAGYVIDYMLESREQNDLYQDLQDIMASHAATRPSGQIRPTAPTPNSPTGSVNPSGSADPTDSVGPSGSVDPTDSVDPSTGADPDIPIDPNTPTAPSQPSGENPLGILPEYYPIYQMNTDTVGWIIIEDTQINYPVMQTPSRKDYYLNHNFEKKWSVWGAIYVRESCDVNTPSDNVTIYGHQMKDGSMFADLHRYQFYERWQAQPYVYFDTLYEHHTYQIFAVFKTSAIYGEGFSYHVFENANTEKEFDKFVSTAKELSYYDTGVTPKYGDKIITLSTCDGADDNERFVVMAVRID